MNQKILVICTSLRAHSNSDALANSFADGARAAGNEVEIISLKDKRVEFCKGCLACQNTHACILRDDAPEIVEKMRHADAIVFSTPIYYYSVSGQMKTLLDRANPLYGSDCAFRSVYLLTTAAENEPDTPDRAVACLTGWIDCFEKARLAGTVFAGGVDGAGSMEGHPALSEAYQAGAAIE